jgi:hypothetical protein
MPIQGPGGNAYWSLVEIPSRFSASATWLTNTPFKVHFGFSAFGAQDESVALADPNRPTARVFSIQPRLGIEYTVFKNDLTQFDLYAGSYWEPARIEGLSTRTHFTGGAGLKVWAGRASIAFDRAEGYSNFIAGIGIDVLDLAVKIKLIPSRNPSKRPPSRNELIRFRSRTVITRKSQTVHPVECRKVTEVKREEGDFRILRIPRCRYEFRRIDRVPHP